MSTDELLPDNMYECATEYAQRCKLIALELPRITDLHNAMRHPDFLRRHRELRDELAMDYNASRPLTERGPWMTIVIGNYPSKEALCQAVTDHGDQIVDYVRGIIANAQFTLLDTPTELDLYLGTVYEVTGKKEATTAEVWAALDSLGFGECPDETALELRMAYSNQPNHWRGVISKPIMCSDGNLSVLSIARNDSGSWIYSWYAFPEHVWGGDDHLVFRRK